MGREVRRIKPGWQHPRRKNGSYVGLRNGYAEAIRQWNNWEPEDHAGITREQWFGEKPDPHDYMPDWTREEATMLVMYETTSEGKPISPAFSTPEELAHWLADNHASAFGHFTATYEEWLRLCQGAVVPVSAVLTEDGQVLTPPALAREQN